MKIKCLLWMVTCLLLSANAERSFAAEVADDFASPQATFDTAKQAMVRGDYESFCHCFTEEGLRLMAGSLRMMTGMIEWAGKQENADKRSVKMAKGMGRINRRFVESQPAAEIQIDLNASPEEFMASVRKMAEPINDHTGYIAAVFKLLRANDNRPNKNQPMADAVLQNLKVEGESATGVMDGTFLKPRKSEEPLTFRRVGLTWKIEQLGSYGTKVTATSSAPSRQTTRPERKPKQKRSQPKPRKFVMPALTEVSKLKPIDRPDEKGASRVDWMEIEEKPKKMPPGESQDSTDGFGEDAAIWERLERLAEEGKSKAKVDDELNGDARIDMSAVNSLPWRAAVQKATQQSVGRPITLMRVMLEGVDAGSDLSEKIQLASIKLNNFDHFPQGGGMYREILPGGFVIVEHINSARRKNNRDPVTIATTTHNHTKVWVPVPSSGQLGILGDVILSRPETASLGRIVVKVRRDTQQQIQLRRCQVGTIAVGGRYGQSFEFDPDGVCTIDQLAPGTYRMLLPDFDIRKSRWEVTVEPGATTQLTFTAQSQTEVVLDDISHDSKPFVLRSQLDEE